MTAIHRSINETLLRRLQEGRSMPIKDLVIVMDGMRSVEAAVTLATLKPTDNVDSLIARVVGEVAAG